MNILAICIAFIALNGLISLNQHQQSTNAYEDNIDLYVVYPICWDNLSGFIFYFRLTSVDILYTLAIKHSFLIFSDIRVGFEVGLLDSLCIIIDLRIVSLFYNI